VNQCSELGARDYAGPYLFPVTVAGFVELDPSRRAGFGTITVGNIALPTYGNWSFPTPPAQVTAY